MGRGKGEGVKWTGFGLERGFVFSIRLIDWYMYLFIPLIVIIIIIVIVILLLLLLLEDTNLSSYLDTASRERERDGGWEGEWFDLVERIEDRIVISKALCVCDHMR